MPLWTVKHLALVNELLPGSSPVGAYCLGMASYEIARRGLRTNRRLLQKMRAMDTVEHGTMALDSWLISQGIPGIGGSHGQ